MTFHITMALWEKEDGCAEEIHIFRIDEYDKHQYKNKYEDVYKKRIRENVELLFKDVKTPCPIGTFDIHSNEGIYTGFLTVYFDSKTNKGKITEMTNDIYKTIVKWK